MKARVLAGLGLVVVALAPLGVARGQDAPPPPASDSSSKAAPAGETRPAPPPAHETPDAEVEGFSFGSNPHEIVNGAFDLFVAGLKGRSHFGFREANGSRNGEVAFVEDAGWPSNVLVPGVRLTFSLGQFGFLSEDFQVLDVNNAQGTFQRERTTNQVLFEPGDQTHSHGDIIWSNLVYGYEFRYRFAPDKDWPFEIYAAPEISWGLIDEDVRIRRVAPTPTNELGGHATAWAFGIGARAGVDLFDHFLLGAEFTELPGTWGVSSPRLRLWERVRAYAGVRFFHVELQIGYRLQASHLQGDARGTDMRLIGFDTSLGVSF
jgi:hypothetical protein